MERVTCSTKTNTYFIKTSLDMSSESYCVSGLSPGSYSFSLFTLFSRCPQSSRLLQMLVLLTLGTLVCYIPMVFQWPQNAYCGNKWALQWIIAFTVTREKHVRCRDVEPKPRSLNNTFPALLLENLQTLQFFPLHPRGWTVAAAVS